MVPLLELLTTQTILWWTVKRRRQLRKKSEEICVNKKRLNESIANVLHSAARLAETDVRQLSYDTWYAV
jgi:hypothetical protein